MLEHHTFVLQVSKKLYSLLWEDNYRFLNYSHYRNQPDEAEHYLVSGSTTAWLHATRNPAVDLIVTYLGNRFPLLLGDTAESGEQIPAILSESGIIHANDEEQWAKLMNTEKIMQLPAKIRRDHLAVTAKFVVDRGVSHEIVRHRPVSYAQESTRYCNYAHEKYEGDLQWILPLWVQQKWLGIWEYTESDGISRMVRGNGEEICDITEEKEKVFFRSIQVAEKAYLKLRELGWEPQLARDVLPVSLKTELYATAVLSEWEHFFKMRVPATAHPQMREVSLPLQAAMIDAGLIEKE